MRPLIRLHIHVLFATWDAVVIGESYCKYHKIQLKNICESFPSPAVPEFEHSMVPIPRACDVFIKPPTILLNSLLSYL